MTIQRISSVDVTFTEVGKGRPVLLLHGGGGPQTVVPWAERVAAALPVRVLTPVHPGFAGTPRPDDLDSIAGLAQLYLDLLAALHLRDVTVVGNSIGGWIGAEMAARGSARVSGYVLVDAVGLDVPDHPVVDFFSLTPREIAERSYADPDAYGLDPTTLSPAALAMMAANRAALQIYGGDRMADPTLAGRLAGVGAPTLVIWGEADRIGPPELGRALAAAIPDARFVIIPEAGHLPQIETPDALVGLLADFLALSSESPSPR